MTFFKVLRLPKTIWSFSKQKFYFMAVYKVYGKNPADEHLPGFAVGEAAWKLLFEFIAQVFEVFFALFGAFFDFLAGVIGGLF